MADDDDAIERSDGASDTPVDGNAPEAAAAADGPVSTAIAPIELQEEMERSFLDYAMSVITSRALPDARDGLKPVHRRILYGMYEGGMLPDRNHKKCASAVGDVMGKYHPHGDTAIYDALARMAQDFSLRHPLIDGHGNFGSPDPNDRPAAMRYCVVGSTRVRTVDGTPRIDALAELAPNSECAIDTKLVDANGEPVAADRLFHSGVHPTIRVRTREGYEITGTGNHPLLCLDVVAGVPLLQWRLLEEIQPGTIVVIDRHYRDGASDVSEHELVAAAAAARVAVPRVPDFVWTGPLAVKRAFLEALLADGPLQRSSSIRFTTSAQQLARDVQLMLLEFGLATRLASVCNGTTEVRSVDPRDDRAPFVDDYVGSNPPSAEVRSVIAPLVGGGYYYAAVETVEDAGVHPVFSVRVDSESHAFSAGGFVNHNTEARLAPLAMRLLGEIDEDTVDMEPTYDGANQQPVVLPARFPNLLVNGVGGIAVGMATNIPPHNLGEVIDATVHLIDHPDADIRELMAFVKGPDFPTGAQVLGKVGIEEMYLHGRGSIKMRAVAEIEEHRGSHRIVVSEIPYQTSPEVIGQKIAELVNDRRIEGVRDVRNATAGDTISLVIDLKRDANAQVVLNQLYKNTPMQTSFAANILALVEGVPRHLSLKDALEVYVKHQVEVITRRTEHRLAKDRRRAHIVEGLLRALDMIDAIIQLIRGSEDAAAARDALGAEPFSFSEEQAQHILDMQLRRLAQLEGQRLRDEYDELVARIADLEAILADDGRKRTVIKEELLDVKEKFATPRMTQLLADPGEIATLDLIDDEELVLMLSNGGYVKTVSPDAFRSQGRGGRGITGAKLREEDYVEHLLMTTAHSYLLFFSNRGRVYRLRAHEIPLMERTARGTALINLLALQPDEHVEAIIDTRTYEDGAYLFFATRNGTVKRTRMSEYDSSLRTGLIAINLNEGDELVKVVQTRGDDEIFLVSRDGMTIRFHEDDVRAMGRAAAGVRGMRLKNERDGVVSCDVARDDAVMLFVSSSGHGKRTRLDAFHTQGRGGQGVRGMKVTENRGVVVSAMTVSDEDEILVFSSSGNVIRTGVGEISIQGRAGTGVRVARVADGESVVAVARVLEASDAADDDGRAEMGPDSQEG